jgi:acyl transferase domain-containing protein/glutamate-1-semialdehyde aminotransferase
MAEQSSGDEERTGLEVAVVGMAVRVPGAGDVDTFWRNLRDGVESITFHTREALLAAGVGAAQVDHPHFVPARGEVQGADEMDAALFDLTPRDAEILNPQHRVLLECAWAALEHAGCDPDRVGRPIGVFAGSGSNTYLLNLVSTPGLVGAVGMTRLSVSNEKDQLAAGISYRLNLRGPSMAVQTACSTSLVAVHVACQSLINGECDVALAGGVTIGVPLRGGYLYAQDGILSPDGHCRAFDADAKGTVGGSGAGLVVLKRLEDALEDGDTIHAVIRGSAVNNDGAQKVGYTAPSVTGQARVISEALTVAGVDAASLQYLETHGTGTPLGDAIELKAMGQVFAKAGVGGGNGQPCLIGSVKTNLGHLDAAAGVAGLIKTVLSLSHGEIPPSLNFAAPHPEIAASGGRVAVNAALRPWTRTGTPRRAGVSSFGIGGTNAHVVLEEAPVAEPSGPSRPLQLLVVSARTPSALAAAAENLAAHLESAAPPLADAAYTLQTGRREMAHRLAVVCADMAEAASALRAAAVRPTVAADRTDRPVAFLFPGLGMHHVDMGRGLYDAEPIYRAAVDECCELLRPVLGSDLRAVLFSAGAADGGDEKSGGGWDLRRLLRRGTNDGATEDAEDGADATEGSPLDDTRFAQPAVFVTEYALAKLWMQWGVRPRGLLGHSLGEYVAACIAGVMRLEDALRLVALRARLIDALPAGAMLAVPLGEAALRDRLPAGLDVAAVNTPESCVVAGDVAEVEAFESALAERGIVSRRLPTRHAFHSRAMLPVAAELERLLADVKLRAPEIPFVSNVTGKWISDAEARSPAYWARHLCETVRFADGVATLRQEAGWVMLEVGPGQTLGAWALQHAGDAAPERPAVFSSLRHQHNRVDDLRFLLQTLGGLWAAGVTVDWMAFSQDERRRRIPLPVYPFERKRYWIDPPGRTAAAPAPPIDVPAEPIPAEPIPVEPVAAEPVVARPMGAAPSQSKPVTADRAGGIVAEWTDVAAADGTQAIGNAAQAGGAGEDASHDGASHEGEAGVMTENAIALRADESAPSARHGAVMQRLKGMAAELTGIDEAYIATDVHFFEAGIDSLLLLQAIQAIEKHMGVRVSLVEMLEEITTLDALADHIDRILPPEFMAPEEAPVPLAQLSAPVVAEAADGPATAAEDQPAAVDALASALLPASAAAGLAPGAGESLLERVIAQQLQVMAQQLAAVQAASAGASSPASAGAASAGVGSIASAASNGTSSVASNAVSAAAPAAPAAVPQSPRARIQPEPFVAYQPVNTEKPGGMTPGQRAYLDDFIARYTARTAASKAHQVRYHAPLADSRVTSKFRRAWKEITYPIVGGRAAGSRVWDLDGNEYVDLGMAYGCSLFGHAPPVVSRAIQEQVELGYGVGPQSPLAGRAAELVCTLGGNDRAVFCNSGTEAVLGAIRAARTHTARNKVAYFAGAYHGWSDIVQGRLVNAGGRREVRPAAPGIAALPLDDVLILEWDDPSSLERLAAQLADVAVVLVEPVQSRRPDIQPRAFLHELRRITRDAGTLLLFDELITGFRILPGGAQAFYGIQADLVTYGKIVAGGLPMGVVAGRREVMDVFDGGAWSYGDDSYPLGQRTLFAGAYFKHPLSMAVACAILEEVQRQGTPLYEALNARTAALVGRINAFFEAERIPATAQHFGSVFRFFFGPQVQAADLFNHHLILEGVHVIVETGTCFLSTAHTDEDLEFVFRGVCAAVLAMRRGGFIPTPADRVPASAAAREGRTGADTADSVDARASAASVDSVDGTASVDAIDAIASTDAGDATDSVDDADADEGGAGEGGVRSLPLTEGQRQLWLESQMGEDADRAYVESSAVRLQGPLDVDALRAALQAVVNRHDTLRMTFGPDGDVQRIHPSLELEVPLVDFRGTAPDARAARVDTWLDRNARRPFDLVEGPLVRFALAAVDADEHLLVVTSHHAALDGWSFSVVLRELGPLYAAARDGTPAQLPPPPRHAEQVQAQVAAVDGAAEDYWLRQFADGVPALDLPTDRPRPPVRSYAGGRIRRPLDPALMGKLGAMGRRHGFTVFNTLLSAYFVWLARLSGQDDIVVGIPSAAQAGGTGADLVGYGINVLPIRARVDASLPFVELAKQVRRSVLHAIDHQGFSQPRLVEKLLRTRDASRLPLYSVMLNVDRDGGELSLGGLRARVDSVFAGGVKVDVRFALTEAADGLRLDCEYSTALFDRDTVERWLAAWERLLADVAERPDVPVGDLQMVPNEDLDRIVDAFCDAALLG